jgi:hypothetical protein
MAVSPEARENLKRAITETVTSLAEQVGGDEGQSGEQAASAQGANTDGEPRTGEAGGEGESKDFSDKTKDKIRDRDGNKCVFCKKDTSNEPGPDKSEIDHATSKKNGGNNSENNGQNTCRTCNRQKGGKNTEEYLGWLSRLLGK